MKYFKVVLFLLFALNATAQQLQFTIHRLSLPPEVSYYDNQFSGLAIHNNQLLLMSESRLQDKAEGKLYVVDLPEAERSIADTSYIAPWKKFHIYNLDSLRNKIDINGKIYEGLEAMTIEGDDIYFSIETATPAPDCYLIKGKLTDTAVIMDKDFLMALPKFTRADGTHIYNAGFEAMAKKGEFFFAIYEYNYFPSGNNVYVMDKYSFTGNHCFHLFPIDKTPFRITDITNTGPDHFTGINYFYKGEGEDTVYRIPATDSINDHLIKEKGIYKNYSRLIDLELTGSRISWKPVWDIPAEYSDYNWEGIAAYKDGYFIINDKYSTRPYKSTLLYLERK